MTIDDSTTNDQFAQRQAGAGAISADDADKDAAARAQEAQKEPLLVKIFVLLQLGFYYFLADMRKRRLGFVALLIEPFGSFCIYYFFLYMVMGRKSAELIWHFMVGIFILSSMREMSNEVSSARNKGLGVTSVTPVPLHDIIVIRMIVALLNALIILTVMAGILIIFGQFATNWMLLSNFLIIMFMGFALGLFFLSLRTYFADFEIAVGMFFRLVFFTSGILFMGSTVAPGILQYVINSPFLIAIAEMRGSLMGDPGFENYNRLLLLAFFAFMLPISVIMYRVSKVRLRNTR